MMKRCWPKSCFTVFASWLLYNKHLEKKKGKDKV